MIEAKLHKWTLHCHSWHSDDVAHEHMYGHERWLRKLAIDMRQTKLPWVICRIVDTYSSCNFISKIDGVMKLWDSFVATITLQRAAYLVNRFQWFPRRFATQSVMWKLTCAVSIAISKPATEAYAAGSLCRPALESSLQKVTVFSWLTEGSKRGPMLWSPDMRSSICTSPQSASTVATETSLHNKASQSRPESKTRILNVAEVSDT